MISIVSDDFNCLEGLVNFIDVPCCVSLNKFNEYTAVKNLTRLSGIAFHVDCDIILVISIISLNKLNDGGAAIFTDRSINHHIHKIGLIKSIPFVK